MWLGGQGGRPSAYFLPPLTRLGRSIRVKGSPRLARVLAALRAAPASRGRFAPLTRLPLSGVLSVGAGSRLPKAPRSGLALTLNRSGRACASGGRTKGAARQDCPPEPPGGEGGESREAAPLWARRSRAATPRPKGAGARSEAPRVKSSEAQVTPCSMQGRAGRFPCPGTGQGALSCFSASRRNSAGPLGRKAQGRTYANCRLPCALRGNHSPASAGLSAFGNRR